MLAIVLVVCVVCLVPVRNEAEVTEWVQRRQSGDIYKTNGSGAHQLCGNVTRTYLVDINQCVEDKQLLKGCNYSVVPMESSQLTAIANIDSNVLNLTYLKVDSLDKNARFYIRETKQALNNSLCHIVSLEVYRGRDETTEIRHDGFSISYDGSIEINKGRLAYSSEQFEGELFRMNLSCFNIPESGCLFFKARGKVFANFITNAKFNCTVSGTLHNLSDECNITMVTTTSPTSPTMIVNSTTTQTVKHMKPSLVGVTISVTVVLGGIVGILALIIPGCAIIGFLVKRKKGSVSVVVSTDHEEESLEDLQSPQNGFYDSIDNYRQATRDKEESTLDVAISSSRYTKNPAYIHLAPEEESQDLLAYSTGVARMQHQQTCIITDMSATTSASPSRCIIHAHSSSDMNSQMVHSQNLANIHLNLGEISSKSVTVLISVSKAIQTTAYVAGYSTPTPRDDAPITSLDLLEQSSESDGLLITFWKCNGDSQLLHPNESSEEGPPTPSHAHSKPRFIRVDLENQNNQSVLIPDGNAPCGQMSVGYTNVDPIKSSQITPKFQSKHYTDHARVNINSEEDSSSAALTPHR